MALQALSYEEWNSLLLNRHFGEDRAGEPAYLDIDDDSLDAVAGADQPGEGASSLRHAVRPRLRLDDDGRFFDTVFQDATAWAGGGYHGAPPFLPTLAAAVLAASRMAPEAGVSTANYYIRLRECLDIRGDPQVAYRETMPAMFRMLETWLDQRCHGRRGQSTLPRDPHPSVVGLALSQALMREADRRRLSQFFTRLGLAPADAGHANDLVPALRRWAERSSLTAAGKRFVANRALEAQLVHLLTTELRHWDQAERDDEGRRVGVIQILLRVVPNPR